MVNLKEWDRQRWPSWLLPMKKPITKPKIVWKFGSSITVPMVGLLSRFWTTCLNTTTVHNHHVFLNVTNQHYRDNKKPLITICNHTSCIDDPLVWGALLPWKWHLNSDRQRWSAAAEEICFSKTSHAVFFAFGKTFPVVRGMSIYQPSMDFAVELLKERAWLHVFPQGKVTSEIKDVKLNESVDDQINSVTLRSDEDAIKIYELKWGLARIILDVLYENPGSSVSLLPFYHVGMDEVLPTKIPYRPKIGKKVTINVREEGPIDINLNLISQLTNKKTNRRSQRIAIMKFVENELKMLKIRTHKLHQELNS